MQQCNQAAYAMRLSAAAAWISSSNAVAMQTQLPQPAPQPVRMVSSAIVEQPASAVWRIIRSVTPLQMQTYMAGNNFQESFSFTHG
jgi:hypothetical protein